MAALLAWPAAAAQALATPLRQVGPGVLAAQASEMGGDAAWGARVVLIEPAQVRFLVRFDESRPRLPEWRSRYPDALAIINGSYYSADPQTRPTCDLVAEGHLLRGAGCRRRDSLFFGALAAGSSPPRLMQPRDFAPGDWVEALKSFPALVQDGVAGCEGERYCTRPSRTSALGQLRDGRVVLFASQWPAVRTGVARFLAETLGAAWAVNLDGGPETTLQLRDDPPGESVATPGEPLPLVLVVLPAPPPPPPVVPTPTHEGRGPRRQR